MSARARPLVTVTDRAWGGVASDSHSFVPKRLSSAACAPGAAWTAAGLGSAQCGDAPRTSRRACNAGGAGVTLPGLRRGVWAPRARLGAALRAAAPGSRAEPRGLRRVAGRPRVPRTKAGLSPGGSSAPVHGLHPRDARHPCASPCAGPAPASPACSGGAAGPGGRAPIASRFSGARGGLPPAARSLPPPKRRAPGSGPAARPPPARRQRFESSGPGPSPSPEDPPFSAVRAAGTRRGREGT